MLQSKPILIEPMYGMPISCFDTICANQSVVFELGGWYRKRTYRNRAKILAPNGSNLLSIPLKAGKNSKMPIKDVQIDNAFKWQTEHFNAMRTAYNSTPFFSLLHPECNTLYTQEYTYLVDFQLKWWETLLAVLQIPIQWDVTEDFVENISDYEDKRDVWNSKTQLNVPAYYQLFKSSNGFQQDLFIWDRIVHIGR